MSQQTFVIQESPGTSGLAIAGLIFAILGWFTCGLLCIPGAFLSFLGLFSRGPKGAAIAGLIVGFPGTLFFAFFGLAMILSVLGISAGAVGASSSAVSEVRTASHETQARNDAAAESEATERAENLDPAPVVPAENTAPALTIEPALTNELEPEPSIQPAPIESEPILQPESESSDPVFRTWTTADGQFSVEAKFVKFIAGMLTLEKRDGSEVSVKLEILSSEDQDFVRELGR